MVSSLYKAYEKYFKIGAAVSRRTVHTHKDLLKEHFNSITCENEMKYSSVCKNFGEYDFDGADAIYNFAVENDKTVRGHALVWHNQTPDFIFQDKSRSSVTQLLKDHMRKMAERYDKNVYAWDVVNEAIEDKTDEFLRNTKWQDALGDDYIADVFTIADSIYKGKDLYYNDYNESNPVKRKKIIGLIQQLIDKGIPIHGVGLQSHININEPSMDLIKEGIELYAKLGLKISITEMDVSMFSYHDHTSLLKPSAEMIEKQANCYKQCFKIFRDYSKHIDTVTLWGIADDATWLDSFPVRNRKNWPLLFNENHEPKEAFHRIMDF